MTLQTSIRIHQNFLEWVFVSTFWIMVAMLSNPKAALIGSSLVVGGRFLYSFGYGCISIRARIPGMGCMMLGALTLFVLNMMVIFGEKQKGVWKTLPL